MQGGIADLLAVGRRQDAAGESNPAVIDWRSQAAVGLLHLGDRAGARDLASQELALAERFGAPGPIGVAERAIGLVEGGDRGLEWLQRAASTLEFSSARLEHRGRSSTSVPRCDGPDAGTEPADPCVTAAHSPNSAVRPPSSTPR